MVCPNISASFTCREETNTETMDRGRGKMAQDVGGRSPCHGWGEREEEGGVRQGLEGAGWMGSED